jgi:hypothetical protein
MARQQQKSWRQSPQVWPDNRPSQRDDFTVSSALSPGTGLDCPCREQIVLLA